MSDTRKSEIEREQYIKRESKREIGERKRETDIHRKREIKGGGKGRGGEQERDGLCLDKLSFQFMCV